MNELKQTLLDRIAKERPSTLEGIRNIAADVFGRNIKSLKEFNEWLDKNGNQFLQRIKG